MSDIATPEEKKVIKEEEEEGDAINLEEMVEYLIDERKDLGI